MPAGRNYRGSCSMAAVFTIKAQWEKRSCQLGWEAAKATFERCYYHDRPYVEELYQTYQAQLKEWAAQF